MSTSTDTNLSKQNQIGWKVVPKIGQCCQKLAKQIIQNRLHLRVFLLPIFYLGCTFGISAKISAKNRLTERISNVGLNFEPDFSISSLPSRGSLSIVLFFSLVSPFLFLTTCTHSYVLGTTLSKKAYALSKWFHDPSFTAPVCPLHACLRVLSQAPLGLVLAL